MHSPWLSMKPIPLAHTDASQTTVYRGMSQFPGRLAETLGDRSPASLSIAGNVELLSIMDSGQRRTVGLVASVDASAAVLEETNRLVRALADTGALFVGGFYSPLERRRLGQMVAEKWPVVVFLGRALTDLRIPVAWLQPLREGKLILVSACSPSERRATRESVRMRNECVAALADSFLIPHASVGGKAEALCREVLKVGKEVWTLNHPGGRNLVALGAKMATTGRVSEILDSGRKGLAAFSQSGD